MSRHLKSVIENRLKGIISYYAPHSEISASHRRGVRYIVPIECYDGYWGAMNTVKEGLHYKKHIIVRRVPRGRARLLQLYTYHFPKSWSAACVANRELIKEAQRRAHALEHDHSLATLEWRTRFFHHYYTVFRGGAKPEPGMKPYSYFYQYTYVAIYRDLKAAQKQAEEVTFVPVSDSLSDTSSKYEGLYGGTSARSAFSDYTNAYVYVDRHEPRSDSAPPRRGRGAGRGRMGASVAEGLHALSA